MRYLSLFSGAGGGDLAAQHLDGMAPVAYCEIDPYARRVLEARMADGSLIRAPIFDDVRSLRGGELGEVDIVLGGVPCQPFSSAGKRKAGDDARNLWPEALRLVRETRAQHFFFENVPGLKSAKGGAFFQSLLGEIAAMGYSARWDIVSAQHVGAPHLRERLWIRGIRGQVAATAGARLSGAGALPRAGQVSAFGTQALCPTAPRSSAGGEGAQLDLFGEADRPRATVPTPTAGDAKSSGSRNRPGSRCHAGTSLTDYARGDGGRGRSGPHFAEYPTPTATSYGSGGNGTGNNTTTRGRPSLEAMARMLPMPVAHDARNKPSWSSDRRSLQHVAELCRLRESEPNEMRLNPAWVEWLMGWPVGWTSLEPMPPQTFEAWRTTAPWDLPEPPINAARAPGWKDRLRCIGNGQVSLCASVAFQGLRMEAER